jgi:hypothetical protein
MTGAVTNHVRVFLSFFAGTTCVSCPDLMSTWSYRFGTKVSILVRKDVSPPVPEVGRGLGLRNKRLNASLFHRDPVVVVVVVATAGLGCEVLFKKTARWDQ